jgi:hypothetical protein
MLHAHTMQTIELAPLDFRAAVGAVNEDTRTVDLTFSTGADVVRYDWMTGKRYIERLSMKPEHIRLDRLNSGAPLLDSHSAYSIANVIGAVEEGSAKLVGKEGRSRVRFSRRADVEPFYQDVKDKIIRNVSAGYRTYAIESLGFDKKSGLEIRLSVDWEPYEISMVPMGADAFAQTRAGRPGTQLRTSKEVATNPCIVIARAVEDADRRRRFRLAQVRS